MGIGGGGQAEGIGGGEKGEINRWQRDDHRCDIVLVLATKITYNACPPFLLPLVWLSQP